MLATLGPHFYVAFMKLAARFLLFLALLSPSASYSQVDAEDFKRLAGEMADLREANSSHLRRITQMQKEIESLRDALRESHERATSKMGDFATREDLKKIVESIKDVDQKRESDRKLILEEFEKLGKSLAQPVERGNNGGRKTTKEKEPEKEAPAQPIEGTFLPYKVKEGQRLADIVKEYNAALKEQGRPSIGFEQIKRANPKININRILVGQEILLPVPEKKK